MNQEKLDLCREVKDYLEANPESSARAACRKFKVCHVAFHRFIKGGCIGKTIYEQNRERLRPIIELIGHFTPNTSPYTISRALKANGERTSAYLVAQLLDKPTSEPIQ